MSVFAEYILDPFLKSAEKFENRYAFCIKEKFYTYKDLTKSISKIRIAIQKKGVTNKIIGLVANDDLETYASIFALWMEGKCYVPMNPDHPIDRSLEVIEQTGISLILDTSKITRFSEYAVIHTNALKYEKDCLEIEDNYSDDELAYILFTSGSTGKPKGVTATRSNLSAFVDSFMNAGYDITENDRFLQYCNLTFDISIASYLPPLLKGACVYTVPNDVIKYSYIADLLEEHKLTFTYMVPSIIRYLRPYFNEIRLPFLRFSLFGGEALPLDLATEWAGCIPNATIVNTAGPTEDTVTDIRYFFNRTGKNKTHNGILCIGKPLKNAQMMIIDEQENEVGVKVVGELCLSGEQLTPGYWNNPERNTSQFFMRDGTRWYKSGDLCYYDEDGDIFICGRLDSYVKVQGFRVEMGEIEFHAKEYLGNNNVVAIAFENKEGFIEIAMFIESVDCKEDKLLTYLRSKMPAYMIPSKLIFKPILPRNENDKIDRLSLKACMIE